MPLVCDSEQLHYFEHWTFAHFHLKHRPKADLGIFSLKKVITVFFIYEGSRQRLSTLTDSPTITKHDSHVSQVTTTKSLGVTIDNKLDWSSHIDKLTKKVASGIGAMKRIRHLLPQATLHLIYQALIQPHFDYCNIVWGNCGLTLQNKIQKLHNRAARVLTNSNYDSPGNT